PEWSSARHHRQRVWRQRHRHLCHHGHAVGAHYHGTRRRAGERLAKILLGYADEVLHLMTHGIHRVMRLVTVKGPISRRIGDEIDRAYRADWHINRCLGKLRAFGHPTSVGAAHRDMMAMQMDWMVGHGEIGHPNPHAVT